MPCFKKAQDKVLGGTEAFWEVFLQSRMQEPHRRPPETIRNALELARRERNHRASLLHRIPPIRELLGIPVCRLNHYLCRTPNA
jgi:hypothetical protein